MLLSLYQSYIIFATKIPQGIFTKYTFHYIIESYHIDGHLAHADMIYSYSIIVAFDALSSLLLHNCQTF